MLGDKSVMDIPFTQTNLSRKTMETFGENAGKPFAAILSNVPGVRNTGTALHSDYYIRGLKLNGTSATLNGVPLMFTQFSNPTFMIDRIEVLEGPNLGVSGSAPTYESTPAAGVVNMVSKRAGDTPITSYKQVFSGKSGMAEYLDVGRRFGENNEWGIRVNAEVQDGNPTQYDADIKARGMYVNIDHRDENSSSNFLIGERVYRVDNGGRWFRFSQKHNENITHLPSAPDGTNSYGFDGMSKRNRNFEMVLNHTQKFNDHISGFVNAGYNFNHMYRNSAPASSRFWIMDDNGTLSDGDVIGGGSGYNSETPQKTYYFQAGLKGNFNIGSVNNEVVFAIDRSYVYMMGQIEKSITYNAGSGTLNSGFSGTPNKPIPKYSYYQYKTVNRYSGWNLADTLTYGKIELLLGIHGHTARVNTKNQQGQYTKSVKTDDTLPTFGLTYRPNEKLSLYAGHSEYFDQGTIVTGNAPDKKPYLNDGDILDPSKTKQTEFGIKYLNHGVLNSLAFFETKQRSVVGIYKPNVDRWAYENVGENKFRGVEWQIQGRLASKWNVMGGLMYEKATRENGALDENGVSLNGKKIQPSWHATAALEYNPNEQWSVFGRVEYNGAADMYPFMDTDNSVRFKVPSYTTFDLGASYATKINGTKATFTLMCENLFNKDYWVLYNTFDLHLSTPRTIWLSAKFDF